MSKASQSLEKPIYWEYTAYYCMAVFMENILYPFVRNSATFLTFIATGILIYLVNKAIILKKFTFKQTFQFTLLVMLCAGCVAGIVQAAYRYNLNQKIYDNLYLQIQESYSKAGISQQTTDQVFNFFSNPISIFFFNILAGILIGAFIGLFMGFVAKSRLDTTKEL